MPFAWSVTAVPIAIAAYVLTLAIPIPGRIDLAFRYALWPAALAAAALYWGLATEHGAGRAIAIALTFVVFALPLAALWNTGTSEPNVLAGLLPWSDANGYYADARRLLAGEPFSLFSSRRPLFAGTLAMLLGVTGMNLQVTLAILVAAVAVSALLLAREVQATDGTVAAVFVLVLLFLFFRRFAGTTLTENLGVALGSSALALLWRGGRTRHVISIALGLFLLALALAARAGAFLVLIALVLWTPWALGHERSRSRSRSRRRAWFSALALGVAAVALAMALNTVVLRAIGAPGGLAFSNYAYHFYGIVVGGKGWGQALIDHQDLARLQEPERSKATYRLAVAALRQNPGRALKGVLGSWIDYASPGGVGAFGFVFAPNARALNVGLRVLLFFLTVIGLITCWRGRADPTRALAGATTLGIVLSVPLVPPRDADQMRAYAATIPCSAVVAAIGLAACARRAGWVALVRAPARGSSGRLTLAWGAALAALITIGPLATKAMAGSGGEPPSSDRIPACEGGTQAFRLAIDPGSYVRLVDDVASRTRVPDVRVSDFVQGLGALGHPAAVEELRRLRVGAIAARRADVRTDELIWMIGARGTVDVCGRAMPSAATGAYIFLWAEHRP